MSYSKGLAKINVALLVVILAGLPWPFACVSPVIARWLFYAACLLWLLFAGRLLAARWFTGNEQFSGRPWPKTVQRIGLLGFLGLIWGGFQLVPLPPGILSSIAPGNGRVWQLADRASTDRHLIPATQTDASVTDRGESKHVVSHWRPISVYPSYGQRACEWLALGTTFFLFAAFAGRHGSAAAIIVGSVAVTGFAVAAFGLVQKLTWNGFLYWCVPFPWIAEPFGPFVNRNNAAGYINLALGAGLATVGYLWSSARSSFTRFVVMAALLVAAGTMLTAILASGSRGGLISFLVATSAVVCFVAQRWTQRAWILVGAAALVSLVSVGLLGWLTDGHVWQRYATLLDWHTYASDGRVMNWQAAGRALRHFAVLGTGYGTYRYAYGPYEEQYSPQWLVHAENVFVEVTLEGGFVAGLLLVLGILTAARSLCSTKGTTTLSPTFYMRLAGLFVLVSQVVHNVMDLGIYIPANMLTFATLMGVTLSGSCQAPPQQGTDTKIPDSGICLGCSFYRYLLQLAIPVLAVLVLSGAYHISSYGPVEEQVRLVRRSLERRQPLSDPDLHHCIDQLDRSLRRYPRSAEGWLTLAELHMDAYRRSARNHPWPLPPQYAAQCHHWEAVFALAMRAYYQADLDSIRRLRAWPPTEQWLYPAYMELVRARQLCPMIGKVYLGLAKLAWLNDASPGYDSSLAAAVYCAPVDPSVLLPAAMMYWLAGDTGMARQLLGRLEQLQPQLKERLREFLPADLVRSH